MPRTTDRFSARLSLLCACLAFASGAQARSVRPPATVQAMARSAARVFRGRCAAVAIETADVGGVRLPVTAYTFQVREHLKGGGGARTITFRQVGTPDGGPGDLGRLVGLPVYAPGTEYVLFLLPESRAGVTSPAGAAEGAFIVRDDVVASVRGTAMPSAPAPAARTRTAGRPTAADAPASYAALRRAVLDEVAR